MAKFFGKIGFVIPINTGDSVYEEEPIERDYYGDVLKNNRKWENGDGLNDNINLNNTISILSDAYSNQNFANIRYIVWMGSAWKVTNIEVQRPRLILTIGGVYNGITVGSGPCIG